MIVNSQRTIYAVDLNIDQLLNKQYEPLVNTTLNEKFGILPLETVENGVYPVLNYYTLGVGGREIIDDGAYKFSKHRSIDAALFEHIPFIMRPLNTDLVASERAKYRLRKEETISGEIYACYYMKLIPGHNVRNGIYEVTNSDNLSALKFMNTNRSDLLNPVPRLVKDYLNVSSNTYYAKVAKLEFSLYKEELDEIANVMELRFGVQRNLTEIGICTGIEKNISPDVNEAVNVVTNYFVEVDIDTAIYINSTTNLIRSIEIGGIEPSVS